MKREKYMVSWIIFSEFHQCETFTENMRPYMVVREKKYVRLAAAENLRDKLNEKGIFAILQRI